MSKPESFQDLIGRVRVGDEQAAAQLVRTYEAQIRREVRLRMTDPRLRRLVDSMDICQSEITTGVAIGKLLVVHTEQVEHGGVKIVYVNTILDGVHA